MVWASLAMNISLLTECKMVRVSFGYKHRTPNGVQSDQDTRSNFLKSQQAYVSPLGFPLIARCFCGGSCWVMLTGEF